MRRHPLQKRHIIAARLKEIKRILFRGFSKCNLLKKSLTSKDSPQAIWIASIVTCISE